MNTVNAFIRGPISDDNYQYKTVIIKRYQDLQSQLIYPNTKYVIKHNFNLDGQTIEIPSNCIIAIDGGSLSNGVLVGNNSILLDVNKLGNTLDNITQSGTWKDTIQLDSISIGEVVSGDIPSVTNVGDNHNAILNFVLPRGEKGEKGPQGLQGRTGAQGLKGDQGPKGEKGDTGEQGIQGIQGEIGKSAYQSYLDTTEDNPPLSESDWILSLKGPQGDQGIQGEQGIQGIQGEIGPQGPKGDMGPQGEQGPKGDTVTATDYTLYNVQGSSSEGAMSQDATTKAISAQTGYYTCGTSAGTAAKVVTVESGNLYKRTLGGHFKVKMTNANTAASEVTLKIGSETAAPLLYNGEAVSASNSWDAGEVISVYYDGSVYQASNAQGGGGKAEKIKYDSSKTEIGSDNVQDALDELGKELYGGDTIYPFELGTIDGATGEEIASTNGTRIRTKGNVPKSTNKINFTVTRDCTHANIILYNNGSFVGSVQGEILGITAGTYVYKVNVEYAWDSYRIVCFTSGYTSQNLDGNYSIRYSSIKDTVIRLDENVDNINDVLPHGDAGSVSLELSESDYSVGLISGTDGNIHPDLNCRYLTEPLDVRSASSISYSIDNSYRIGFAVYSEDGRFLRKDEWFTDSGTYQLNGAAKIRIQLAYPSGMSDTFDYASANPQFMIKQKGLKQVASMEYVDSLRDAIYNGEDYPFELGSIDGSTGIPVENTTGSRIRSKEYIPKGDGVMRLTMVMAATHVNIICYKNGDYAGWVASAFNDISAGDYAYKITVPFDYDTYKVVCNVTGATTVSANNTFVALPPAACFKDAEDINIEALTTAKIYEYYDALAEKFPNYISKRVLGMDTSGQHEIREYVATLRDNYAYLYKERCYAWKNGSTTIFTESVSPRVGDATYSDQLTTSTGYTVSASNCNNLTIMVNGTTYSRQESEDIAADIQYRSTGTSSSITVGGKTYNRLPNYDKSSICKKTIVSICNEHGPGINGDPREPSVVMYLLLKELCGETSENPQLDWLKHYAKLVIIPVSNPYAYDEEGNSTTLGNMMGRVNPNGVNINRNYPTTNWVTLANNEAGAYGGSEIETQYNINCIMRHNADIAIDEHCLGPNTNNYNQWHYEGLLSSNISSEKQMMMLATYNLAYSSYGASLAGHGSTWIEQHDTDGCLLEMNQGYRDTLHSSLILRADRQIWLGILDYYNIFVL